MAATGRCWLFFKEYGTDSSIGLIASVLIGNYRDRALLYEYLLQFRGNKKNLDRYTLAGGLYHLSRRVAQRQYRKTYR